MTRGCKSQAGHASSASIPQTLPISQVELSSCGMRLDAGGGRVQEGPSTNAGVPEESAQTASQITKGEARELISKSLPVPDDVLRSSSASLYQVATKHRQQRQAVSPLDTLPLCGVPPPVCPVVRLHMADASGELLALHLPCGKTRCSRDRLTGLLASLLLWCVALCRTAALYAYWLEKRLHDACFILSSRLAPYSTLYTVSALYLTAYVSGG